MLNGPYFGSAYWGAAFWGGGSGGPVLALAPDGLGFRARRVAESRPLQADTARVGASGGSRPGMTNTRRGGRG